MTMRLNLRSEAICIAAIAIVAAFIALSAFLVRPALWFDEGITIEIARNFALFGKLDILTAPHIFSGVPYLVGTNGFPLTLPLAAAFKLFGLGLVQARVLMLFWFAGMLAALYIAARKLFGPEAAVTAAALAVTFSSLYANGLTATGEAPGLLFFLLGAWLLIREKQYFWMGICWGLAMAAKPGVFLLLAHTTVIYVLVFDRSGWFRKIACAAAGMAIPVVIWVVLAFPLTTGTFYSIVTYALNPIDIPVVTTLLHHLPAQSVEQYLIAPPTHSAQEYVRANLAEFATDTTLIYFALLAILVIGGLWTDTRPIPRRFVRVLAVYGALTLFFFFRGPGWHRYLIGFQVLLMVGVYPAFQRIAESLRPLIRLPAATIASGAAAALVILQALQFGFFSDIPESPRVIEALGSVRSLMAEYPNATIGTYDIPEITAFTDPSRTFDESLPEEGLPQLGASPLLMPVPPDLVIMSKEHTLLGPAEEIVLRSSYRQILPDSKYDFYERKDSDAL